MACMPWYKVHAGWTTHEKVLTLCALLGDDRADVYVGRLWDYCAQRRGDGRFAGPAAAGLMEAAVRFGGAAGTLADAMVQAGLLERHEDGTLEVHDWAREQRAIAAKFEVDRRRPNAKARATKPSPPETPRGVPSKPPGGFATGSESDPPETPGWESREKRVEKVQTPSESVGPADARPPAAPVDMFPDTPTNPPRAKPDSPSAEWARWAVDTRQPVMPPDATAETSLKGHQWAVLGQALKAHGRILLEAAFRLYLQDDYARERAFPIGLFVAQVERWTGDAKAEAARARTGGPSAATPAQPRRLVEM
ncbi:putative replication initiation protein [Myxococcus phage Mx9]|nr:putative replication initiation protein [Myxococcus phage Mx9]